MVPLCFSLPPRTPAGLTPALAVRHAGRLINQFGLITDMAGNEAAETLTDMLGSDWIIFKAYRFF